MRKKLTVWFTLLSFSILVLAHTSQSFVALATPPRADLESIDWKNAVDYTKVREHVVFLSSHGSRVTGYPGYYSSKEYIKSVFNETGRGYEYGFELEAQPYNITLPIEYETRLEITSPSNLAQEVKAYTLWPNEIQTSPTPPDGVSGRLIYVGEGNLEDFDGYDVEGSIVLMDFNSGENWLNAAKLGAKGVIFIEPEETIYLQCIRKFLDSSIHFTRLYVSREDGELLKKASEVRMVSRMFYRKIEADNIIAKFNGTTQPNDVLVISAHFDAWSPVPNVSYAAHEAIGPSVLLELAKFFRDHPPSRSVWLVALSGHWEALAGAREFVEKYYFSPEASRGNQRLWIMLNIWGIDSEGDGLQFLVTGHYNFYGAKPSDSNLYLRYTGFHGMIERYLGETELVQPFREVMKDEFGLPSNTPWNFTEGTIHHNTYVSTTLWYGTEAYPYMLDSEPVAIAGSIGVSVSTRNTYRQYRGTPKNDIEGIDFKRIKPQFMVIAYLVYRLAVEEQNGWQINWSDVEPTRINMVNPHRSWPGFITLRGKVVTYNVSSGWYQPVPGALVEAAVSYAYRFKTVRTIADEKGEYVIHGIAPAATGGTAVEVMLTATGTLFEWATNAWVINEYDGTIEYALDQGIYGVRQTSNFVAPLRHPEEVTTVIARCVPVTLFDVVDPRSLRPSMILDPRFSGYWQSGLTRAGFFYFSPSGVGVIDFDTKSPLLRYGLYYVRWDQVAMVFVPPKARFVIGQGFMGATWPTLTLVNSTEDALEGKGFVADKPMKITFTAYKVALDMLRMSKNRYSMMSSRFAGSASAEKKIQMAEAHIAKVEQAISRKAWSEAYREALSAWALAFRAYAGEVMPLINDSSTSALVIFALTILSAFFWERLLIHKEEKTRILSMVAVGGVLLTIFSFIHPAMTLMSNVFMGLLGSLIFIIFIISLMLLTRLGEQVRKTFELEILGLHRSELSWVDVVSTSISVGLENMRKRRFRTVLTLTTIVATTIALCTFTSISYYTFEEVVRGGERGYNAPGYYNGLLIKVGWGAPPDGALDPAVVQAIRSVVGEDAYVLPRAWYYPPSHPYRSPYVFENLTTPYGSDIVFSVLGITLEDFNMTWKTATRGFGFFGEEMYRSCIISTDTANELFPPKIGETPHPEVAIGKTIRAFGLNLTITGVFDTMLLQTDLDTPSELLSTWDYGTPVDARFNNLLSPAGTLPLLTVGIPVVPTSPNRTLIIPYELAMDLGGYVAEVSVKFKDDITRERLESYAKEIAAWFDGKVFMSWDGVVYRISRIRSFRALGWELIPLILVIGALNVATTILGSVKERTNDIFVFSSVGLSPLGASVLFLVESSAYAVIGTTLGYLGGLGLNAFLIVVNIVPAGHVFNYASIFIVVALVAILVSALASSLYPSIVAARLITPSLERRWKPSTKPHHDEWNIDLPAVLTSIDEAYGLTQYLWEYFTGAGAARPSYMIREVSPPSFEELKLGLLVSLAPYETHTDQRVVIQCFQPKDQENVYHLGVYLKMVSGNRSVWVSSNYYLIDDLRKQILMWRSLPSDMRDKRIVTARACLAKKE